MAVFEYQAIAKATGKTVKGIIDADSPAAARRKLREQSLYPTDVQESFERGATKGVMVEKARGGGFACATCR